MSITETVLEMHFHRPIMDLIREAFGLGPGGQMNFYKWSPQKECFVGFDQAYVRTPLRDDEFFNLLKTSAASQQYQLNDIFFGYFLQFKVVRQMQKRNRYTPDQVENSLHYRVNLDTAKNLQTGSSQHELLYRLSKNNGALVYYACPMVFDKTDLYEVNVDLDKLRLVELESCQDIYEDNDKHYIFFDNLNSEPIWRSEPHAGRAISPTEFAKTLVTKFARVEPANSRQVLWDILADIRSLDIQDIVRLAEESLTIVRVRRE
jgi:hypothetical protein